MSFYRSNLADEAESQFVHVAAETAAKSVRDVHARHVIRLREAYAEIDRLTAENADLRKRLEQQADPPKPQWTPPASLKDGVYRWNRDGLSVPCGLWSPDASLLVLRDWTDPPCDGRWRVADGMAEYLGQ